MEGAIRPSAVPLRTGCRSLGTLSNESRLNAERIRETRAPFDCALAKPSGDSGGGSSEDAVVNSRVIQRVKRVLTCRRWQSIIIGAETEEQE